MIRRSYWKYQYLLRRVGPSLAGLALYAGYARILPEDPRYAMDPTGNKNINTNNHNDIKNSMSATTAQHMDNDIAIAPADNLNNDVTTAAQKSQLGAGGYTGKTK
jgi:hypothetical protein